MSGSLGISYFGSSVPPPPGPFVGLKIQPDRSRASPAHIIASRLYRIRLGCRGEMVFRSAGRVGNSSLGCLLPLNPTRMCPKNQPWRGEPRSKRPRYRRRSEPDPKQPPQVSPCPCTGDIPPILPAGHGPLGVRPLGERDVRVSLEERVGRGLGSLDDEMVGVEAQLPPRR